MVDAAEKLAYFQAITGLEDNDLCTDILSAHGWDLEQAISTFTAPNSDNPSASTAVAEGVGSSDQFNTESNQAIVERRAAPPGLAWKLITLPFSVISGGVGLIFGAIGLGMWAAGGVLSYSLSRIGLNSIRSGESSSPLVSLSAAASEAMEFVASFERDYGTTRPNFVAEGFMDALQRSRHAFKLMFVYLHSPNHPDTTLFCERTLCSEALAAFVNENFVAWGGNIRASEGFKMTNSLKASRFPFCAVVMAAADQRIALLQQIEGPKSPEEMLTILQRVLEESSPVLVSARLDAEERRTNIRLREEQDAAYRAALEADQARERQRKEEEEQLAREAAEAEKKQKEEEEARERAAREAAEKEAALARMRKEKAQSLGAEPEKGSDVTPVLVRFPNGERKGRRFPGSATIHSLYDYVDSLGYIDVESYRLVSSFPRVVYGPDKLSLSLKEAGLHPQASLFVELNS
ncbi:plant UBX domain-containing protein 10-like isoform X1 [Actinidia eriantha]|uniref:plant UBX domain-containing protein 10-like isoform X1 n=1 Tax=Actinidia eriantha TaxID=165200 RepID=UPI00258F8743|nr:plant UBX domain-containing protein 10-like isoform X1 [Actinidia eriantha]